MVCAATGYFLVNTMADSTMADSFSIEQRKLNRSLGIIAVLLHGGDKSVKMDKHHIILHRTVAKGAIPFNHIFRLL